MLTLESAENLAARISHSVSAHHAIAFLEGDGVVYFARQPDSPTPGAPSAVVRLIQGIYERSPEQARRLVRNRIYSTAEPTEMCWGMTKVAARRLTAPIIARDHRLHTELPLVELGAAAALSPRARGGTGDSFPLSLWSGSRPPSTDADFMSLARRLARQASRGPVLHECDREVGALLVSRDGRILAWGINSNASNKTLHAEVNLIQSYCHATHEGLPAGATLFATLKPCRMCAGMIWTCAERLETFRVLYDLPDPGPHARGTVLDAGSPDRRRVPRAPAELSLDIQRRLEVIAECS